MCAVVNPDAEAIAELATEPARAPSEQQRHGLEREQAGQWRVSRNILPRPPDDREQQDHDDVRRAMEESNTLCASIRGNGEPVDESEDRCDEAAHDPGRDVPI